MRALGPLPRGVRLFNTVGVPMSPSAQQAFLSSGFRGGRQSDNVVGGEEAAPGGRPRATVTENRQWYRITNQAGGTAVVDIYDEIGYWGVMAAEFQRELSAITATEITVNLNSPGGEIFDGIAIYNALRSHPANVTVRVSSLAASIASVIAQAGDRIVMQSGSQMMIHEGSGLCMGDAADMRQMADLLDRQSDNIASIYAERAGGAPEEWRTRMRAETWFNAEEAVAAGLADEVEAPVRKEEQPEPVAARWDLTVFNYAGRDHAPAPVLNQQPVAPATGGVVAQALVDVGEGGTDCVVPNSTTALRGEHGPESVELPAETTPVVATAPPEPNGWASLTAHLCEPAPNPWAALVAHLTDNHASSSTATSTHA